VKALRVDRTDSSRLFALEFRWPVGQTLIRTQDRGGSWEFLRVDPFDLGMSASDLEQDRTDPDRLWTVGDFAVTFGRLAGLATSPDGGDSWVISAGPEQCLKPEDLAIDPLDGNRLYLAGRPYTPCQSGCYVWTSPDAGQEWTCIQPDVPYERLEHIEAHPGVSGLLLATGREGLYRSLDFGTVWTLVQSNPAPPGPPGQDPLLFTHVVWADDDTAYASNLGAGLFVSHDRGLTWASPLQLPGDVPERPWLTALVVDPFRVNTAYALSKASSLENPLEVVRTQNGGLTWSALSTGLDGDILLELVIDPITPNRLYVTVDGGGVLAYDIQEPEPCVPSATAVCVHTGRFKVESLWRDFSGQSGVGHAQQLAEDTGSFWFFDPDNLELFVKEIDGTDFNNAFWTFYGALSNVEFTVLATDTATGAQHGYFNPSRSFASLGDIDSFPQEESLVSSAADPRTRAFSARIRALPQRSTDSCAPDATTLCLQDGRFAASVTWRDFAGRTGVGTPLPLTPDTGSFWFFDAGIHELAVKVIDGRGTNDAFWVFYGSLSNVEFDLTVVDTVTGDHWTRHNPSGTFASNGDIEAFPQ
jgi:hypothetical protein